ncbi:MAG: Hsp70 family protein, partial [Clostridia bacterium]|nr:Hsp70 family protein [Clostridia bacterium]
DLARRHNDLPKDSEFFYGGYMPNGYVSDGEITVGEFEECLAPLLGWQYQFEDYKHIKDIQDDQNIIYPILNVLGKAAETLGTENLKVDAVIMNGGMSRLYLIENRIASFFGFEPITINDPDKSVAQGASVYHYYLHQNDNSNLNRFYRDQKVNKQESGKTASVARTVFEDVTEYQQNHGIRSVSRTQNETIYLGLRGGAVIPLVNSGQELPFKSNKISGFSILTGQNRIRIPIKQATLQDGEYQTIAAGEIVFKNRIYSETPVSIQVNIRRSGIIAIDAWTSHDSQGLSVIEKGTVALNIGDSETEPLNRARGRAINPPLGTKLIVANELSSFKSLVNRLRKTHQVAQKNDIVAKIKRWKNSVINCGNPDEFASGILELLEKDSSTAIAVNILPIARKFSIYWTKQEQEKLSAACLTVLNKELYGLATSSLEVNANIEAIKTIGFCGIIKDCENIQELCQIAKYRNAFLYAYAYCGLHQEWIYEQLLLDIKHNNPLQDSLWAMGLSIHKAALLIDGLELGKLIMQQIASGCLLQNELNIAVVTLGMLCSQIKDNGLFQSEGFCSQIRSAIENIRQIYEPQQWENTLKARSIANEFITGENLSEENEKILLSLLTK